MHEYRRYASISLVAFIGLILLVTVTSPSIRFAGIIFLYFVLLAIFLFFGLLAVFGFLGILGRGRSRFYATFVTSFIVLLQLLATFRALRMVETLLLALTFSTVGWFMSKRNSK